MTSAAGFTVPAAIFHGLPRCRIHTARPLARCLGATFGAGYRFAAVFYKFIKFFSALRTLVLQNGHGLILPAASVSGARTFDLVLDLNGIGGTDHKKRQHARNHDTDPDDHPKSPGKPLEGNGYVHSP